MRSILSKPCLFGILWPIAFCSCHPISGWTPWTLMSATGSLLDNPRYDLHRAPSLHPCHLARLRSDFVDDVGNMVPMTPPHLWGRWLQGVLISPLPVTPPFSPGTPEGPPPPTPPEAFFSWCTSGASSPRCFTGHPWLTSPWLVKMSSCIRTASRPTR